MSAAVNFQSHVLGAEIFSSFQHSNISTARRVRVALARQRAQAISKLSCSVSQNLWEKNIFCDEMTPGLIFSNVI